MSLDDFGKAAVDSTINTFNPVATFTKIRKLKQVMSSTDPSGRLGRNLVDTAEGFGNELVNSIATDALGFTDTSFGDTANAFGVHHTQSSVKNSGASRKLGRLLSGGDLNRAKKAKERVEAASGQLAKSALDAIRTDNNDNKCGTSSSQSSDCKN